ncbi:hypothetical protein FBU30_004546 [Linnemannia zychae]|nr:hypothetical protein FBU30_004546 [Linnemannia zychae]
MPSSNTLENDTSLVADDPAIPAPHPLSTSSFPLQQQAQKPQKLHLIVPQIINNSTTLLQKSPVSTGEDDDDDQETFFSAVISPITSINETESSLMPNNSTLGEDDGKDEKQPISLKRLTMITLEDSNENDSGNDKIVKTATLSVDEEHQSIEQIVEKVETTDEKERILAQQVDRSYSEWNDNASVSSSKASCDDIPDVEKDVMNAVQELRLIHRPQTGNFLILVDQLRAMRKAAETLQSEDVGILSSALTKSECVFERHQRLDQVLETDPSKEETIKALYELVSTSAKDTIALIQDWSIVYYALQELVLRIRTITTSLVTNPKNVGIKSPKSRRSLFGRKPSMNSGSTANLNWNASTATLGGLGTPIGGGGVTPQFSPEVLRHQHEVCANWAAQMRTFEQLARAYRSFANQMTAFTLIHEIDTISQYYDSEIRSTFERAHTVFLNSKKLSQLHEQIDYSNMYKTLNKSMALTTIEDRMMFPQFVPLFTRSLIGERKLVREGKLVEFVSRKALEANAAAIALAEKGGKKKNIPAPIRPKEYRLIVTTDMIYMCEIVTTPTAQETLKPSSSSTSSNKKTLDSKNTLKTTTGSALSLATSVPQKSLRLCHEPVLIIDAQISSTPDVVYPPVIQKDMVMVCFYNDTTYILQADSGPVRDAWVECARALNIEQPKPSASCREQDELYELQQNCSSSTLALLGGGSSIFKNGIGNGSAGAGGNGIGAGGKSGKVSLLRRLKSLRRSSANVQSDDNGPIPEIHPDQLTLNDEEEYARRMQLGQPSLWEVRRLPLDLGVIPPLEHPIPFRKRHLYDISVQIEDLTTGKTAPGEFGMGIEDRAAYFRDECALFAVLRPARLIPSHAIDRKRDDFFLCKKRMHKGEIHYVEPPYITDFYARSWLHPEMHIEFHPESRTVMIANMYKITCSTSEIVSEFKKYHAWLMENARISPDNTFLCMDYRSKALRVSKRIERAASSAPQTLLSAEETRTLEGGRKYTELGECHMEFRRMSNAPDALSVGFYNPATKRDMAIGVMVFDKMKVKATASSLGLNALNALGATNGVVRVSPTEISLTMWQTDARTRPRFIKGQRVFETVKSKSLDVFKLVGSRDALDELEQFIRVKMGTDCKARDIPETFRLIELAFQDQVLDSCTEEASFGGGNVFERRRMQLQRSVSKPRSVKSIGSSLGRSSAASTPALPPLYIDSGRFNENDTKSTNSAKSIKSPIEKILSAATPILSPLACDNSRVVENDAKSSMSVNSLKEDEDAISLREEDEETDCESVNSSCEGYLATVVEEEEEEDSAYTDTNGGTLSKKSSLASSTLTFRPKSKKALQEMQLAQELASQSDPSSIVTTLPQMDPLTFGDLSADSSLADYLSPTEPFVSTSGHRDNEDEETISPTVADLTKFWTNATTQIDTSMSGYSNSHSKSHSSPMSACSTSSVTTPSLSSPSPVSDTPSSPSIPPEIIESSPSNFIAPIGPPSELETLVLALKSTPSHTAIVAQLAEENAAQANAKDLVQATRYLPKHKIQQIAEGCEVLLDDMNESSGVDVDHHMPVKDLKKRWEEIHRLGI